MAVPSHCVHMHTSVCEGSKLWLCLPTAYTYIHVSVRGPSYGCAFPLRTHAYKCLCVLVPTVGLGLRQCTPQQSLRVYLHVCVLACVYVCRCVCVHVYVCVSAYHAGATVDIDVRAAIGENQQHGRLQVRRQTALHTQSHTMRE
jgi:hypothetical protein